MTNPAQTIISEDLNPQEENLALGDNCLSVSSSETTWVSAERETTRGGPDAKKVMKRGMGEEEMEEMKECDT